MIIIDDCPINNIKASLSLSLGEFPLPCLVTLKMFSLRVKILIQS